MTTLEKHLDRTVWQCLQDDCKPELKVHKNTVSQRKPCTCSVQRLCDRVRGGEHGPVAETEGETLFISS